MSQAFFDRQILIFSLFQKDVKEALKEIERVEVDFPHRLDKTSYWKACAYAHLGDKQAAIQSLQQALEQGVWWNPQSLERDPDLQSLQNESAYREIVRTCQSIFEQARKKEKAELYTYGNAESNRVIFSLHWRGSNVEDFAPFWLNESLLQQVHYGFPESTQYYAYNAYCWDDSSIAERDLENTYHQFMEEYHYTPSQVIIGGASQGAKVALEFLLNKKVFHANRFIFVVPSVPKLEVIESLLEANKPYQLRGTIITGDQDPYYNGVLQLVPLLKKYEIDCDLIVKEGMGHFFPDDFTAMLSSIVEELMKEQT